MLQRLLSLIGLTPYIPSPGSFGSASSAPVETDGQVSVTSQAGKKAAPSAAETEDALDQRREHITDSDLVWPGKTETIGFRNEEAVVYRFALTVTDLAPSY